MRPTTNVNKGFGGEMAGWLTEEASLVGAAASFCLICTLFPFRKIGLEQLLTEAEIGKYEQIRGL